MYPVFDPIAAAMELARRGNFVRKLMDGKLFADHESLLGNFRTYVRGLDDYRGENLRELHQFLVKSGLSYRRGNSTGISHTLKLVKHTKVHVFDMNFNTV